MVTALASTLKYTAANIRRGFSYALYRRKLWILNDREVTEFQSVIFATKPVETMVNNRHKTTMGKNLILYVIIEGCTSCRRYRRVQTGLEN